MITASVEIEVTDIRAVVDYKGAPEWELTAMVPWSKHPISPKLYLKRQEDEMEAPWVFPAKYKALVGRGDLLKDRDSGETKSGDVVWNYRYKLLQFPLSDEAPLNQTNNWYKDIFCVPESEGNQQLPDIEEEQLDYVPDSTYVEEVEEERAPNPYGRQPVADYRQAQIMYQAARHDAIPLICAFPDLYLDVEEGYRTPNEIRKAVLRLTNAIFREYWEDMIKPRFPEETL